MRITKFLTILLVVTCIFTAGNSFAEMNLESSMGGVNNAQWETDTDRGGSDYSNFDLAQADPVFCQRKCYGRKKCKARCSREESTVLVKNKRTSC